MLLLLVRSLALSLRLLIVSRGFAALPLSMTSAVSAVVVLLLLLLLLLLGLHLLAYLGLLSLFFGSSLLFFGQLLQSQILIVHHFFLWIQVLHLVICHDTLIIGEHGHLFANDHGIDLSILSEMDLMDRLYDGKLLRIDSHQQVGWITLVLRLHI